MPRILVSLVLVYFIIALTGCAMDMQSEKGTINTALLEPQANLKVSDAPVPAGFKLIPQESYSFEAAGVRVSLLKYQGRANIDQVVSFYREQMAMYNWNLLNVVEYGQRLLNFDRESETCIVSLTPKGNSVMITISIGPKAQQIKKGIGSKPIK